MTRDQKLQASSAAARLMIESEAQGVPVVVLDQRMEHENHYRVSVTFTGRRDDVDEVLVLMKEKYPNAGIKTVKEVEPMNDVIVWMGEP